MTQKNVRPKSVKLEHFYLDKEVCSRCTQTAESLDEAVALLGEVLGAIGVEIEVESTLVETAEQARALRLESSPTVRIDGRDLDPELEEDSCAECSDLANDAINCRVWSWNGDTSRAAPVALIVDGILDTVYGSADNQHRADGQRGEGATEEFELSENLERFFSGAPTQGCGCGC